MVLYERTNDCAIRKNSEKAIVQYNIKIKKKLDNIVQLTIRCGYLILST